jgi:hypothetical protein
MSEPIFTFLYAGSSIQNVSEQFFLLIHLYFENFARSPNPTNTSPTELDLEILVANEQDYRG